MFDLVHTVPWPLLLLSDVRGTENQVKSSFGVLTCKPFLLVDRFAVHHSPRRGVSLMCGTRVNGMSKITYV
jgi:hypothetical protein